MDIPARGASAEAVLAELRAYREDDVPWRDGRSFTNVFLAQQEGAEVTEAAHRMFLWENGLDPTLYPSLLRLENEVVAMARSHLGGDDEVVGNFTSGGTESVMLAVKAARDRARQLRPEGGRPQIVLPLTGHPCFHKAAQYLDVEAVTVPVDPTTFRADVDAMRAAITPDTAMIVGSAPSYAHGVVDPIPELGRLALEHDVLFHVDGCIGAFLLPFYRELGADLPQFDFRVPGVTSMSMDFHKYAFAAKGASVILYRNADLRRHQLFAWARWPGYAIVNSTVQSSKSGGPVAAAWATLCYYGRDGYLREVRRLRDATARVIAGVEAIDGLSVLGSPDMTLIAVTSERANVFELCDAMKRRGWHTFPQLKIGDIPESIHLTILPWNVDHVDAWLECLRECVDEVVARPPSERLGQLRALLETLDFGVLDEEQLDGLLAQAGLGDGNLPSSAAEINQIMNEVPPPARERLMVSYFNQLFRHRAAAEESTSEASG